MNKRVSRQFNTGLLQHGGGRLRVPSLLPCHYAKPRALCRQRCNSKCVSEQTFYRLMQSFALVLFE